MAFDGIFTRSMIIELREKILNGRIVKISQPYPNEVILTIRANRQNYPLLLSANPQYARFQITKIPFTNPKVPTNFTMMLRKHLENAKLIEINQLDNDRVVYFKFSGRNEIGDQVNLVLTVEIMGRYSNVILYNQETKRIIDTIKHVGMDQNRYRTLLPGATYRQPPTQNKVNPFEDDKKMYASLVKEFPNREILAKELLKYYQGLSKLTSLILADYLHQPKKIEDSFQEFLATTALPHPTKIVGKSKNDFSIFSSNEENMESYDDLSTLLDDFYQEQATADRVRQQGSQIIHVVKTNLNKNIKKLKKLSVELKNTQRADDYRIKGELLTTYLYQVSRGEKKVVLPNYYDNENLLEIDLKPQLSPSKNAQRYFKLYQKMKNAVQHISEQIAATKKEINYLENVQTQLELATPADLPDIQYELIKGGYIEVNVKKQSKKYKSTSSPQEFESTDGIRILVGKNNIQNEKLSLHSAKKNYIWLHAKNIPGSHVIIENDNPSEETIYEAAILAAYFSKFRDSAHVPVDYIQVKKLRKPNGSKPGFVVYEGQKTISVTPSIEDIQKLRK